MLCLAMLLACVTSGEERVLATKIEEVTVFPSTALVRRSASAPAGGGRLVIAGLPWGMDPSTLRVRCEGAALLGLEARERRLERAPSERVEALRRQARDLKAELAAFADETAIAGLAERHLVGLLAVEEQTRLEGLRSGQIDVEAWRRNLQFLTRELGTRRAEQRELARKSEDTRAKLADVELELGQAASGGGVPVRDVVLELSGESAARFELEYVVAGAGWTPLYDLRAAADARSVELGYRAQVVQQTGEDWSEVSLALSTARPQLGAQGPDPRSSWLSLADGKVLSAAVEEPAEAVSLEQLKDLGYSNAAGDKAGFLMFDAQVERQGLSVRFRLATRETVQSRSEPSNVLVGKCRLDVTPEYFAAPALDANVWLRGKTRNTSEWAILPGRASVYFGADFIGHAQMDTVQPGEELVLHLGPDPALTLERSKLEDLREGPGVFSSDASRTQRWRVRLKNTGAAAARADGTARVFVREALPRSTDERIAVKLLEPKPAPTSDERWKKEREEQGILTWVLDVPRGGETLLNYGVQVTFPAGMEVLQ